MHNLYEEIATFPIIIIQNKSTNRQVNILGTSRLEEYLQGESFIEKVTFKLILKGRIDFFKADKLYCNNTKILLSYTFAKYFAIHILFHYDTYLSSL